MQKFHTVFKKTGERKTIFFQPNFFRVTRIFHLPNFYMTSVPVHTIDGESLSEIAIHNFEKSKKKSKSALSPMEG